MNNKILIDKVFRPNIVGYYWPEQEFGFPLCAESVKLILGYDPPPKIRVEISKFAFKGSIKVLIKEHVFVLKRLGFAKTHWHKNRIEEYKVKNHIYIKITPLCPQENK